MSRLNEKGAVKYKQDIGGTRLILVYRWNTENAQWIIQRLEITITHGDQEGKLIRLYLCFVCV